jgi:hypothetical protein
MAKKVQQEIRTQDCLLDNHEIFRNAIYFLFTCSTQQPGINARLSLNTKRQRQKQIHCQQTNRQTNKENARSVKVNRLTNYALRHEDVWRSGCIDTHFLDLGTSWRFVVSFTPLPLYPGERAPGTHFIGGWVDPRAGLDDMEK